MLSGESMARESYPVSAVMRWQDTWKSSEKAFPTLKSAIPLPFPSSPRVVDNAISVLLVNLFSASIRLNTPGRYTNKKGERLTQFPGGLAGFVEYTTVSEDRLVKIPPDMPIDRAALLPCGVISGFGAVVNKAKVQPFSSVVVMGAGGVGLNAIQGARFSGAHPIIAVDVLDSKLEAAKAFGATHTINAKKDSNPVNTVREITSGRGADYVIIAVAGIEIKRQGFSMSGQSGMTVAIGHAGREWMSSFDATEFVGGKIMTGSVMGMTRPRIDIPRLIELYQYGRLKLDELISRRYSLVDINEALESSAKGDVMRNVIMF
jgi:S-(hydroxymethyl)glutathione dehydrogenase/alcohol dehydrogenase